MTVAPEALNLTMKKDYLIIGQGLAGSFLAWNLLKRGKSLTIVDQNHEDCSSFAAAGMVNPITGKRLVLSSRCEELLPYAKNVYLQLEKQFGKKIFESKQIIRLFKDDQELVEWEKKSGQTHLKHYYGERRPAGSYGPAINDERGSFIIQQGGYCRTGVLMDSFTRHFEDKGILIKERFCYDDLKILERGVHWRGDSFSKVIFCEGFHSKDNPWFSWLPYNFAKGEILTLSNHDESLPDAVISCGKWHIPTEKNKYMVGSTYGWDKFDCQISETAKEEILRDIGEFIKVPFEVIDHSAGVRPIMKDRMPILGMHPQYSPMGLFNGLASKGLLWGPFYSRQMTEYLVDDKIPEKEVSISRFLKKYWKE